jgi:hypothetical protein
VVLFLVTATFASWPVIRVDAADLEVLGQVIAGPVGPVAVDERTVAVGVGPRLVLLDVTGESPAEVGHSPAFTATVTGIALRGHTAYVAAGAAGLHVVDLSQLTAPRVSGHEPQAATAVAASESLVVTLDGSRLRAFAVGRDGALSPIGEMPTTASRLAVEGAAAYLAAGAEGLVVVSLADPSRPQAVGRMASNGVTSDVALGGGRVYLADGEGGLRVVDATDPSAPAEVAALPLRVDCSQQYGAPCPSPSSVAVSGDLAVVALARCGTAFSCRTPPSLRMVDVSDPAHPQELSSVQVTANPASLALTPERVLVSSAGLWYYAGTSPCQFASGGLDVLTTALKPIARYAPLGDASAVAIFGSHVSLVDSVRAGLVAYDVGDPSRPLPGPWPYGSRSFGMSYGSYAPTDVAVDAAGMRWSTIGAKGSAASTAPAGGVLRASAEVAASSAPARPQNGCSPPPAEDWYKRLALTGDGPVVLDAAGVLRTLDPDGRKQGAVESLAGLREVAASGQRAFVVDDPGTMVHVVDLRDRAAPSVDGTIPGPAARLAVSASGDVLYVAAGSSGVRVILVPSAGLAPEELAAADTPGLAMDVALAGRDLYVADGDGGVRWFDVTSPTNPVERGAVEGLGFVRRVSAVDGGLVVAASTAQMTILRAARPSGQSAYLPMAYR